MLNLCIVLGMVYRHSSSKFLHSAVTRLLVRFAPWSLCSVNDIPCLQITLSAQHSWKSFTICCLWGKCFSPLGKKVNTYLFPCIVSCNGPNMSCQMDTWPPLFQGVFVQQVLVFYTAEIVNILESMPVHLLHSLASNIAV